MSPENLDAYQTAYTESFPYHDENLGMLSAYADRVVRRLQSGPPRRLLSLGIGHEVVTRRLVGEIGRSLETYTIVEGSASIIERFQAGAPPAVHVVHDRFENFTPAAPPHAVEMGFVLEHVDDPEALLRRYQAFVPAGGTIFIAVPNAASLHRRLGHAAGLLDSLYRLSPYDLELGHKRYFDVTSLSRLVTTCGLRIATIQGLQLKPFSTSQMASLGLAREVQQALYTVGSDYPELCNAIYLEACP